MKPTNTRTCFLRILLSFSAMAWLGGSGIAEAEEGRSGDAPRLAGFSSRMEEGGWPPVAIAFSKENGVSGNSGDTPTADMAWGREMLEELDRATAGPSDENGMSIDDILSFRDWCTGAAGGGNLALAISAEEVAVELMFRKLAEDDADCRKVRNAFDRCVRHGMTADYWLATLSAEGIDARNGAAADKSAAEHLRLESVVQYVLKNCAEPFAGAFFPRTDWPRKACLDEFNPYALVWRTMMTERKKIALETCLAMQEATGTIPEEREEFRQVAENCADSILRKRDRLTSWTTAYEVWDHWADALDAVRPGSQPRRSRH